MASYVEHVQYECSDLNILGKFYAEIFDWEIRGSGTENAIGRTYDWIHVGTQNTYIAFRTPYNNLEYDPNSRSYGDHLGIVVDDINQIKNRLEILDVKFIQKGNHPYRERIYIRDPDNNEVEIIQYKSQDMKKRNDYNL